MSLCCHCTESQYAESLYVESIYAECHCAVIVLKVIMLKVIMLRVIMPSVKVLNVMGAVHQIANVNAALVALINPILNS
jgi:hypothetical protein